MEKANIFTAIMWISQNVKYGVSSPQLYFLAVVAPKACLGLDDTI